MLDTVLKIIILDSQRRKIMAELETISIYVDEKLKKKLEKIADAEHRSLSAQVAFMLENIFSENNNK